MKVVILAAGPGERLKPLTSDIPKCLVEVEGKSILERQIEILLGSGVKDFVFCLGPFAENVKTFVNNKFPNIKKEFVRNDLWESTNYIYTMWLAKERMDDDVILLHGDLLFDKSLLENLMKSHKKNCAMVRRGKPPKKDFKALLENGIVKKIGVKVQGINTYFIPPLYKLSRESVSEWMKEIEKFVKEKNTNVYAENAFNNISEKIGLQPIFYENKFCMEIDDHKDLEIAKNHFRNV